MSIIIFMACILAIIIAIAAIKLIFLVLKGIYRLTWWLLTRKSKIKSDRQQKHQQELLQEKDREECHSDPTNRKQDAPASAPDPPQSKTCAPRPDQSDPWRIYCSGTFTPILSPELLPNPEAYDAAQDEACDSSLSLPKKFLSSGDFPELYPRLDMNPFERFTFFYFLNPPYIFIGKN